MCLGIDDRVSDMTYIKYDVTVRYMTKDSPPVSSYPVGGTSGFSKMYKRYLSMNAELDADHRIKVTTHTKQFVVKPEYEGKIQIATQRWASKHREGGPAVIEIDTDTDTVIREEYWFDDKQYTKSEYDLIMLKIKLDILDF